MHKRHWADVKFVEQELFTPILSSKTKKFVKTLCHSIVFPLILPASTYLFKVNDKDNRIMCEVCLKFKNKETRMTLWYFSCWLWADFTYRSSVFIVDFWTSKCRMGSVSKILINTD